MTADRPPSPGLAGLDALVTGDAVVAFRDGTHRVVDPAVTVARWAPQMHRFGITRLAELTELDVIGIPVVQAARPNGRSMSVAQGKGATVAAATASALMEAIETWHAEHLPPSPTCRGSELDGPIIDASRLPRRATDPFDAERPRTWRAGFSLATGERRWVPREVIDLDTTGPDEQREFATSSVGLSSGNVIGEAVAHGLYEVIERDAWALAERRVLDGAAARIGVSDLADGGIGSLMDRFRRAGVSVRLFDATSDIGIACLACFIYDEPVNPFRSQPVSFGLGCHPSPSVAASRAITEAAQSRLTAIAGSRDDLGPNDYAYRRRSDDVEWLRRELAARPVSVDLGELTDRSSGSIRRDLEATIARLASVGLDDVVVVDLTRPDVGLPVVKVLVPGCEDWDTGAVPGARAAEAATR